MILKNYQLSSAVKIDTKSVFLNLDLSGQTGSFFVLFTDNLTGIGIFLILLGFYKLMLSKRLRYNKWSG